MRNFIFKIIVFLGNILPTLTHVNNRLMKKWLIKVLIIIGGLWLIKTLIFLSLLIGLYFLISPYQTCLRDGFHHYTNDENIRRSMCLTETSW